MLAAVAAAADASTLPAASDLIRYTGRFVREASGEVSFAWSHSQMAVTVAPAGGGPWALFANLSGAATGDRFRVDVDGGARAATTFVAAPGKFAFYALANGTGGAAAPVVVALTKISEDLAQRGAAGAARRIVFSDIDDLALGLNSDADVFQVRATLTHIKTDNRTMWYIACPGCKKKLATADEDNLQVSSRASSALASHLTSLSPPSHPFHFLYRATARSATRR